MKVLEESLVLILSFIIVLAWSSVNFQTLTAPFLGLLVATYLILSLRKRGKGFITLGGDGPWGIFILNTLIFVLVFATGSVNSPLFFLLYFLSFGISFVFEPATTFIFIIGALIILLPDAFRIDLTDNIIKLSSLVLISPLAYFFGKEYRNREKDEEEIVELEEGAKEAADTISEDVDEVLDDEKGILDKKDVEKLNDVLEETEELRTEGANQ